SATAVETLRHFEPRDRSKNGCGRLAMPNLHVLTGAGKSSTYPIIRKIGFADLKDAAAKGIDDFRAMPTHVIFLAIIYPVVGLFLFRMTFGHDVMPLLFPLTAGLRADRPLCGHRPLRTESAARKRCRCFVDARFRTAAMPFPRPHRCPGDGLDDRVPDLAHHRTVALPVAVR